MNVYTATVNEVNVRLLITDMDTFFHAEETQYLVAYSMEDEPRVMQVMKKDLLNLKQAD